MIQLKKAVIHRYKCIEQEQSFEVKDDITILMGRNEAGKTSVLEALAKANYFEAKSGQFQYNLMYDYPRKMRRELDRQKKVPLAVTLTYRVSGELEEEIERDLLIPAMHSSFSRITNYEGKHQVTDNGFDYPVSAFLEAYAAKRDKGIRKYIKPLSSVNDAEEFQRFLGKHRQDISKDERVSLEKLAPYFENKYGWENPVNEYVYRTYLLPNIPGFLFYDEYDMLTSRVSLDRLKKGINLTGAERTAKALLLLADIDLTKILETDEFENYKAELEIVQAEFTKEFLNYWTTNQNLCVEFELLRETADDGKTGKKSIFPWSRRKTVLKDYETFLEIRVRDRKNMISLPLEKRSRGFNWFFSFWVWFKAIQKERIGSYVLLLDEPGLNLHASSQRDLMNLMRNISKEDQIIFTTHLPYMLEDMQDNLYCIVNTDEGTTIKPADEETDEETLLPLTFLAKYNQDYSKLNKIGLVPVPETDLNE